MVKPIRVKRCKLVVVGDGACGKTCLLYVASQFGFPEVHIIVNKSFERGLTLFFLLEIYPYRLSKFCTRD